ncbi:uncharacterized membrane protein YoaT (DUF817 family) [Mucilaginibacter lappiensis]|uniref:Uncharacterized membrane protein YoaT (DUF817 family) n=2 Tax=Mucilaginibacter lappiensis TaxID=354630 RepID=A0A841J984_9SPHI|nr:uncharacterized membrane protein YoaT (DUF817 family) [Mucilaginibacter lappiensis]MBB6126912.1 uncharacterized membrane protein YoaT (DUF817 family) [Mucilaginibacter lappiensis]
MVNYQKISSWGFLVIVSFIIVAELKMLKGGVKESASLSVHESSTSSA